MNYSAAQFEKVADQNKHSNHVFWRYFLVFEMISQVWHLEIRPNSHRLFLL